MSQPDQPNQPEGRIDLWPITLLYRQLKDHAAVNAELVDLFRHYQKEKGSQSGENFISPDSFSNQLSHPALDTLKQFLMDSVYEVALSKNKQYWQQFKLSSLNVNITGMWFQICNHYAFHETHVHGNCSWSGVYYVQAGQASKNKTDKLPNGMLNGVTRFYGPGMEFSAAGHGDWGNYYLQDNTCTSYPKDGQLVVFPSYLKHMAYPYHGEQDRIIVSFHAQVDSNDPVKYNYSFS